MLVMGNADNNRKRSTSRKKAQKPSRRADWLLRFSVFLRSKIGLALSVLSIAVLVFANIFLDSRTMVSVPSYALGFVCLAFGIAALFWAWFKNTVGNGLWILHLFLGVLAGVLFFSFVWLVFLGINYAWRSPQSHVYKAVVVDIYMKRAGRSVQHILLLRFVGNDVTYPLTATGSESQTVMVGDTCNLEITRGYLGYYIINGHEWQERYLEPMDSLPDLKHLIEY